MRWEINIPLTLSIVWLNLYEVRSVIITSAVRKETSVEMDYTSNSGQRMIGLKRQYYGFKDNRTGISSDFYPK